MKPTRFRTGQAISNLVVVKLVGGKIQVKVSAGSARILMDVTNPNADSRGTTAPVRPRLPAGIVDLD